MRTPTRALALGAALVLGLTACGGDSPDTAGSGDTTATAPTSDDTTETSTEGGGDAPAAGENTVLLTFFAFDPEQLSVAPGTTVTFVNEDDVRHTVTAGTPDAPEPDLFDLDLPNNGDTVEFTFDEAGTFAYFCDVHKSMTATITVG
jgi:plastocyanin